MQLLCFQSTSKYSILAYRFCVYWSKLYEPSLNILNRLVSMKKSWRLWAGHLKFCTMCPKQICPLWSSFDPAFNPREALALGIHTPQRCHPQSPTTLWCASQSTASWHPWRPVRQEIGRVSGVFVFESTCLQMFTYDVYIYVYITSLFCSGLVNHQKAVAHQVDQLSFGCVCVWCTLTICFLRFCALDMSTFWV